MWNYIFKCFEWLHVSWFQHSSLLLTFQLLSWYRKQTHFSIFYFLIKNEKMNTFSYASIRYTSSDFFPLTLTDLSNVSVYIPTDCETLTTSQLLLPFTLQLTFQLPSKWEFNFTELKLISTYPNPFNAFSTLNAIHTVWTCLQCLHLQLLASSLRFTFLL